LDRYIDEATDTYWMEHLKEHNRQDLHIQGPDYESGKGVRGWVRWLKGQPHPDQVERELADEHRFFIERLKRNKTRYAEVLSLAREYQVKAQRSSTAKTIRKTPAVVPGHRDPAGAVGILK
jgi:hypothetical protein